MLLAFPIHKALTKAQKVFAWRPSQEYIIVVQYFCLTDLSLDTYYSCDTSAHFSSAIKYFLL